MNSYLFNCLLVISCLVVMSSAEEEEEEADLTQHGRRNFQQTGNDFGTFVKDVGRLGTDLIGGIAGQILKGPLGLTGPGFPGF